MSGTPCLHRPRLISPARIVLVTLICSISSNTLASGDLIEAFVKRIQGDHRAALVILESLADQGNAEAEHQVGLMYLHGDGVSRDVGRAVDLLERAATHDNEQAQIAIGRFHADRLEGTLGHCKPIRWYAAAARRGSSEALIAIGDLALRADQSRHLKATAWFMRAARYGDASALLRLGQAKAVAGGQGETPDRRSVENFMWYTLAADFALEADREQALAAALAVREAMMPVQVAEAERLAVHWYKVNILSIASPRAEPEDIAALFLDTFPECEADARAYSARGAAKTRGRRGSLQPVDRTELTADLTEFGGGLH